jgi:plasmid maintenance system antidote protein VapI
MTQWVTPRQETQPVDVEILEEAALVTAQATIQNAIEQAHLSRADLARSMGRPRSFVSRMLSGNHNLTIRTMARALAACGLEAHFSYGPIMWGWVQPEMPPQGCDQVPAQAGTPVPAS